MKPSRRLFFLVISFYVIAALVLNGSGASVASASPHRDATTKVLSTNFIVQNFSSSATASVNVAYYRATNDGGGAWTAAPENTAFTIAPNASATIASYFDTVMSPGRGSAIISSDQALGAVVNQLARNQPATSGAYNGFTQGAGQFYAPLVFRNLNTSAGLINSTLTVQNVGLGPTTARVIYISGITFTPVATTTVPSIPPGESYVLDQSLDGNLTDGYYGSAVVEATTGGGSIAVVGNQFVGPHSLLTYSGFASSDAFTSWAVPFYMCRLSNGFSSIINVQNVSGSTIAIGGIDVEFTPDPSLGGSSFTLSNDTAIPNNATFQINPRVNTACPTGSFGGAKVTSTGNVVVMVNQLQAGAGAALSYNGIRTDSSASRLFTPAVFSRLSNGFSTVLRVQNLTSTSATVYFTYVPSPTCSGCQSYTKQVAIGGNASIQQNHRLGDSSHPLPANWFGSAVVTSTVAIGGIVNELDLDVAAEDGSLSFNMFAP
jgi:hypothetical protein